MATAKQKKAAEKLLEKTGKPVGQAMREAGYSEGAAKNPKQLTESKGWQELMDKYLPEKKVAQVHRELLDAKHLDYLTFPQVVSEQEIKQLIKTAGGQIRKIKHSERTIHVWFYAPDNRIRKDAAELAYKLRARLTQKVVVDPGPDMTEYLDNLEADNHAALAAAAARAVGSAVGRQVVEDEQPVQGPEQRGPAGNIPPESGSA